MLNEMDNTPTLKQKCVYAGPISTQSIHDCTYCVQGDLHLVGCGGPGGGGAGRHENFPLLGGIPPF